LAGTAALGPDLDEHVRAMNEVYQRRRDLVCDALTQAGLEVTPPKGTIYIWVPVPTEFSSSAQYCAHVLDRTGVVISPGAAYGPSGEGFFRISLTTPEDRLREAVERLRAL
jgi:LL-diaminopimelate aminotransferase